MEKESVDEVQKWIDSGSAVSNSTQQVVAGIILMSQNKIDEAMKVLHNSLSLEAFVPFPSSTSFIISMAH